MYIIYWWSIHIDTVIRRERPDGLRLMGLAAWIPERRGICSSARYLSGRLFVCAFREYAWPIYTPSYPPYCMCCAECGRAAAAGRRQAPDDERPGTTSDSIVECRYTSPVSLLACSFSQVRFLLCLSISSSLNALTRAELCMSFFSPYSWVLQFIYSSIDMLYL